MRNFSLSGGHIETLNAAAEVLRAGGNAFDAAIAAYTTSFIAEPAMSSAGGGGFATCLNQGDLFTCDFFSATPRIKPDSKDILIEPVEVHFDDETEIYFADMGTMAVPGAIRGVFKMHREYGTMPIKELFHYAIELASKGVELNAFQNLDLNLLKRIFARSAKGREIFFNQDEIKPIGTLIKMPELADFLETLAIEGEDLFYRGEVGQQLVRDCEEKGGVLDMESLAQFEALISKPIHSKLKDYHIHTIGYPSIGGPLLTYLMNELDHIDLRHKFRSVEYCNEMGELLIKGKGLHTNPDILYNKLGLCLPTGDNRHGSTAHFNIVDKKQNAVSLTMTIGEGSGYFIPGTGIHMNNMLGEPGLLPNGINSWTPNTRMRSMMSPTIVTDREHTFVMALGTGGAVRIPFMLAQVLHNRLSEHCSLQEAIDRPRMHFDAEVMHVECSDLAQQSLAFDCRHWKDNSLYFGGVNIIDAMSDSIESYGDQRRDGMHLCE